MTSTEPWDGLFVRRDGEPVSDALLLQASRDGSSAAFGVLYARHREHGLAVARRALGRDDASLAEDVVEAAFIEVFNAVRNGSGPMDTLRYYITTAVRRQAWRSLRRQRREADTVERWLGPAEREGARPVEEAEELPGAALGAHALLADAFADLPERWRHVLWLTEVEGRRSAEVASLLDVSASTAAALAYRARRGLVVAYLAAYAATRADPDCRRIAPRLVPYVAVTPGDGDVGVRRHLERCASCRDACRGIDVSSLGALVPFGLLTGGLWAKGIVAGAGWNAAAGAGVAGGTAGVAATTTAGSSAGTSAMSGSGASAGPGAAAGAGVATGGIVAASVAVVAALVVGAVAAIAFVVGGGGTTARGAAEVEGPATVSSAPDRLSDAGPPRPSTRDEASVTAPGSTPAVDRPDTTSTPAGPAVVATTAADREELTPSTSPKATALVPAAVVVLPLPEITATTAAPSVPTTTTTTTTTTTGSPSTTTSAVTTTTVPGDPPAATGALLGRVLVVSDAVADGLAGVEVQAFQPFGGASHRARTDADGRWRFDAVTAGTYLVLAHVPATYRPADPDDAVDPWIGTEHWVAVLGFVRVDDRPLDLVDLRLRLR